MVPADLEPVVSIERESPSPWTPAQVLEELDNTASLVFVADDGTGTVRGWCCCRVLEGEAELLKIAVSSESRRIGIGRKLLDALCSCLVSRGVSELFLEVRSHNRSAIALYNIIGFQQVGLRAGYYSDPKDDAMLLKLVLSHD